MWYEGLFEELEKQADQEQAERMSAYMKNQFLFLGVPKPKLKEIMKPYLKIGKKADMDWNFVELCWSKPYREAQYIGVEYILLQQKKLVDTDLIKIKECITNKSWWETVDSLDAVVGTIVLKYPERKEEMLRWSVSDNLWLRRVAIDFQQEYKELTDQPLFEKIICNNLGSSEFFINKSIGWSLRDYSKVNPEWVRNFLMKYSDRLAPLSKKEAGKYL